MSDERRTPAGGWTPAGSHAWTAAELKTLIAAERNGNPFLASRDADTGRMLMVELPGERAAAMPITIGRGSEVDLDLGFDSEVSRSHCRLERIGGSWAISDDGLSRNGTFVNGERVVGVKRLADRDVIQCGQSLVLFRDPGEGDTTMTRLSSQTTVATRLTPAQLKVLEALAKPCLAGTRFTAPASNSEIAEELFVSVDTVKSHLRALFREFGLEDAPQNQKRSQLVEAAVAAGLLRETEIDSATAPEDPPRQ